ncbi:MAG: tetratricopeptide repeat protein [Magnetococcales bacterium]|nr:tetratricopeptide repeat protein [Magnetococcales bacterium]
MNETALHPPADPQNMSVEHALSLVSGQIAEGRLAEADQLCFQILQQLPDHAPSLNARGVIAQLSGRHDDAIAWFRSAVSLDQAQPSVYENLRFSLQAAGRADEAEQVRTPLSPCRKRAAMHPDDPEAQLALAQALLERDHLRDEAVVRLKQGAQRHPNHVETLFTLGMALINSQDHQEALVPLRKVVARHPDHTKGLLILCRVLIELGELQEAEGHLHRYVEMHPADMEATEKLAMLYRVTGRYEQALALYSKLMASHPNHVMIQRHMATILHGLGRPEEAQRYAFKAQQDHLESGVLPWTTWHQPFNEMFDHWDRGETAWVDRSPRVWQYDAEDGPDVAYELHQAQEVEADTHPMRIQLLFPPCSQPAPPLGIATLKAYVEQRSSFRVQCRDLNTQFLRALMAGIERGETVLPLNQAQQQRLAECFGYFKRNTVHERSSELFTRFISTLSTSLDRQCRDALECGAPTPPWILEWADQVLAESPDVVGFSLMFQEQYALSVLMANVLKVRCPSLSIIFGGALIKEEMGEQVLAGHTLVDHLVLLSGEAPFLALLNALDGQSSFESVPRLFRNQGGQVRLNPQEACASEVEPKADFSDLDLRHYLTAEPVVPIAGSRGCYWRRCSFCTHWHSYGESYSVADVNRFVDAMEWYMGQGIRNFHLVDEMVAPRRFELIGREILRRGLKPNYYAIARPTGFSRETLEVMAQSGCRYIRWGVESGCQRILDLIDKGTHVEEIRRLLRDAAQVGIKNHLFLIVGLPSERKEELAESLQFLFDEQASIDAMQYAVFGLMKGSRIYHEPERFMIDAIHEHPLTGKLKYSVSEGTSQEENFENFRRYVPYFDTFSSFSFSMSMLSHHALLVYAQPQGIVVDRPRRIDRPSLYEGQSV